MMVVLELELVLLAEVDGLPIVEVLVVGELHIEIRHAGREVFHLVDVLGRNGGGD
jgi:hypothetical protein